VLVRLDHVARLVVNANHGVMRGGDRNVTLAQVILRRALGTDSPVIGSRKRRSGVKSGAALALPELVLTLT
jgi:hypothetical protein